jgi:hypothetical protein
LVEEFEIFFLESFDRLAFRIAHHDPHHNQIAFYLQLERELVLRPL